MADRVLILGAGVYQVPLIATVQRRGFEAVVASRPGPYPGVALANTFLPLDITDHEGILAAAREFGIRAIVTAGADAGLVALGQVVTELGLSGPGAEAAAHSANKAEMKAAFTSGGVPSARFGFFADPGPALAFAEELGFPVMVKPPDSSGSRGVIRVDESASFAAAFATALAHSQLGGVIVEACLSGREYGAQAVVHGNQVVGIFIHEDTLHTGAITTPVGHALPTTLTPAEIAQTEDAVVSAVAAMKLQDCVANVDLMLTDHGPHVIEIGARMGATGIPEMINLYTGWDIYEHVLDLALGDRSPLPPFQCRPNAVTLLRSDKSGIIKSLAVPPEIRDHPRLVDLAWDVKVGDPVRAFQVGPDRIGQLQVTGEDATQAAELAETLRKGLKIVLQESP